MKILKVGIDLAKWNTAITCYSCHSELEIESSDIKYQASSSNDYLWRDTPEFSVDCLVCKRKVVLDKKSIPQIILTNARENNKR